MNYEELEKLLCGKYRVKQDIGKGGMGIVYKVFCIQDKQYYAAKVIINNEVTDGSKESFMLNKLKHHMLPEIKEIFNYQSCTIIVMELIKGCNMDIYIKKKGPVKEGKAIYYMKQLTDVLLYLHNQEEPVIYRDLKPANIMIEKNDRLRLIDFGTARSYKKMEENDTVSLGTPGYAAPEQLMGTAQSDIRTDIYSLGASMYYMLTGIDAAKPPFEILPIHTVRSDISNNMEEIINKCMERNPDNRFKNVIEVLCALENRENVNNKKKYNMINIMIVSSNKNI